MKKIEMLLFFGLLINLNSALCQTYKEEYIINEKGIAVQQNGKDTLCIIDPMPEFPGGQLKMLEFIGNNTIYPKKAKRDNIEGRVVLSFVIDKTGEILDIQIIRSVRADLDNEAIRVVKNMPKWKPGVQKGKKVSVKFVLPVMFKLE